MADRRLLVVSLASLMVVACGSNRASDRDQAGPRQQAAANAGRGESAAMPASSERAYQNEHDDKTSSSTANRKKKAVDPDCVRIEWQTRNVASMSGGAMQMIQVPVCIKAKPAADQPSSATPRR